MEVRKGWSHREGHRQTRAEVSGYGLSLIGSRAMRLQGFRWNPKRHVVVARVAREAVGIPQAAGMCVQAGPALRTRPLQRLQGEAPVPAPPGEVGASAQDPQEPGGVRRDHRHHGSHDHRDDDNADDTAQAPGLGSRPEMGSGRGGVESEERDAAVRFEGTVEVWGRRLF